VKLNFKGKSPLAAMTCESTQPTLDATTQYGKFVLAVIQLFAAYNCRKGYTMIDDHVTVLQNVKLHLQGRRAISWRV